MKIKNNISKYIFLLSILVFSSCNDFLDKYPLDQVSERTFWKTAADLDAYIVGRYEWLPNGMLWKEDAKSDNMIAGTHAGGFSKYMNGEMITPTDAGSGSWSWSDIRTINIFLDNYHRCEEPWDKYKHTVGEACFLKAMKYRNLVTLFGDVPWYSNTLAMEDEAEMMKPQTPRAVVVDSIMALIDRSYELLKKKSEAGNNRLNKETALIYKSRVALFEATWAKYHNGTPSASGVDANKYFQKVIDAYNEFKTLTGGLNNVIYTTGNPETDYYNLFNRFDYKDVNEVMLSRKYSQALGVTHNWNRMCALSYENTGYALDLVQAYLDKDGNTIDVTNRTIFPSTGSAYISELAEKLDPRFKQSCFIPGDLINSVTPGWIDSLWTIPALFGAQYEEAPSGFHPKKGHNVLGPIQNNTDPLIAGICFRTAEIILNYVEAYVELNGSFPDLSDNLDLLRKRVNMPPLTGNMPTITKEWPNYGYAISNELAIIRQERRIELAAEGFRQNDWRRWRAHALFNGKRQKGYRFNKDDFGSKNVSNVQVDENGYVDYYRKGLPDGYKFRPEQDYLYPIPLGDLVRNPNLKQNPGWSIPSGK
jgi:SusD family.